MVSPVFVRSDNPKQSSWYENVRTASQSSGMSNAKVVVLLGNVSYVDPYIRCTTTVLPIHMYALFS